MSEPSDQPTTAHEPIAPATATDLAPGGQPPTQRSDPPTGRTSGRDLRRAAIGAAAALLVLAVGGVVFAAAQLGRPGVTAVDPQHLARERNVQSDRPGSRGHAPVRERLRERLERLERRGDRDSRGRIPGHGSLAFREITISAISGSAVTLATDDGWARTITVTDTTTITRAGETIGLADLKVGDQVHLKQQRNDDGTYTVTAIEVILPRVVGEVSAISGDTITVERRDGTSATIHVGASTTYHVRGVDSATLSDVTVGMVIVAPGEQNADGSLQAVAVYATAKR